MEFCPVQNSLYAQVVRSPILAALLHGTSAVGVSQTLQRGTIKGRELRNFHTGRHLYSAGQLSRRASAHILVSYFLSNTSAKNYRIRIVYVKII